MKVNISGDPVMIFYDKSKRRMISLSIDETDGDNEANILVRDGLGKTSMTIQASDNQDGRYFASVDVSKVDINNPSITNVLSFPSSVID